MVVNTKRMGRTRVRTKSGTTLGRLISFDIEAHSGKLAALHVAPRGAVAGLLSDELLITWQNVLSLGEDEIIVQDGYIPYSVAQLTKLLAHATGTSAVAHLKLNVHPSVHGPQP